MNKCPRCGSPLTITLNGAEDLPTRSRTLMCTCCLWRKSTWEPNPNFRAIVVEKTKDQIHKKQKPTINPNPITTAYLD